MGPLLSILEKNLLITDWSKMKFSSEAILTLPCHNNNNALYTKEAPCQPLWDVIVDEAYGLLSRENWLNRQARNPIGLDIDALECEIKNV